MASITEVFRAGSTQVGTIIRMTVLSYFISTHNAQLARVLPGRDNARRVYPNRGLPETFRQTWKPFPQPSEIPLWSTSTTNIVFNDRDTFSETQVMDKPGIFFPDDINPWTTWSACSDNLQTRTRGPPEYAKQMRCGHLECVQTRSCRSTSATRSSQLGDWSQWSNCDRGSQFRTRNCQLGNECVGARYEAQNCLLSPLNPADRTWGQQLLCSNPSQYNSRYCAGGPSNNGYQRVRTPQQRFLNK